MLPWESGLLMDRDLILSIRVSETLRPVAFLRLTDIYDLLGEAIENEQSGLPC